MADVSTDRALWLAQNALPYEPALRAWLQRRKVEGLDIDDVIQETYARLATLEKVETIREPKRYMFQAAYSIVAGHLRRSRVVSISLAADVDYLGVASPEASPEQELIYRDELKELAAALASLPPACREAFTLRRVAGFSQKDTAEHLKISEKTVEKYMAKSVHLLMDRFGRGGKTPSRTSRTWKNRFRAKDGRDLKLGD